MGESDIFYDDLKKRILDGKRGLGESRDVAGSFSFHRIRDCGDVFRSVSAATAGQIEKSGVSESGHVIRHVVRFQVKAGGSQGIGKSGVGIAGEMTGRDFGEIFEEGLHEVRAQGTV